MADEVKSRHLLHKNFFPDDDDEDGAVEDDWPPPATTSHPLCKVAVLPFSLFLCGDDERCDSEKRFALRYRNNRPAKK